MGDDAQGDGWRVKILFIAHYFPRPNNPTAGTWALEQAESFVRLGMEVRVVSPIPLIPPWLARLARVKESASTCPERHDFGSIRVDYLRWPLYTMAGLGRFVNADPGRATALAYPFLAGRLREIMREFCPDVVYAHHSQFGGEIARRITEGTKTPYFVTDHSFGELESCARNSKRRAHYGRIASGAARWIAVSRRMQGIMDRVWPGLRTTTVYNGSNLPESVDASSRAGGPVFLSVAFMYPRKNMPLLIRAFGRSQAASYDATLIVAGDGADYGACVAEVERSPLNDRIRLLGSVDHQEVLRLLTGCDAFVLVGRDEPFGVAYTEAMAYGKPIVYCSDSGIAEVVRDGVEGIEVPPDDEDAVVDALDRLMEDEAMRLRMGGAAGRLLRSQLTWEASSRRMESIFGEALRGTATS